MLDRILDFLFHKTLGICLSIGSAVILMLTLSSCVPFDFCACWCGGLCGDDCGTCFEDCSVECDDECFYCFGGEYDENGGYVEDSSCAINECLFGRYGCDSECGDCYTVCGGVNLSCWESVCSEGICADCYDTEYGTKRVTWFNCTSYCDGTEDPDSPNFEATYLYSVTLVDYYGNRTEFKIYDNTDSMPFDSVEGMEFRGYYSEPNGGGTKYSGSMLPSSGATVYAYYTDIYEGMDFIFEVYQRWKKNSTDYVVGNKVGSFTIASGDDLAYAFSNEISVIPKLDGYKFVQISKDGYSYDGWSDVYTPIKIGDEFGIITNYATFQPVKYTFENVDSTTGLVKIYIDYEEIKYNVIVNYPDSFGLEPTNYTYEFGDTLAEVYEDMPRKVKGKIFAGLCSTKDGDFSLPADTEIYPDMVVYAIFKDPITVKFDSDPDDDNNELEEHEYYEGEVVELPVPKTAPTGTQFDYWVNSEDFSVTYAGEITVSAELDGMVLAAKFKTAVYNITLHDGEAVLDTLHHVYGTELTLPNLNDDFKEFLGWYDNEKFSGKAITSISATSTGDKDLYAKFNPKKFTVEMDPVGGTLSAYTKQVAYGTKFTLPVPSRSGYTFDGWFYASDAGEQRLTDNAGQSLKAFDKYNGYQYASPTNLDIIVYAKWTGNTYTITFEGDGIDTTTTTCSHGNYLPRPSDPTRPGYTFAGWYLGSSEFDFTNTKISGAITLKAKFIPKTYTIKLVISESGASFQNSGTTTVTITYTFGTGKITLNDKPVRSGFIFTGWYTQANKVGSFCIRPDGNATSQLDAYLAADADGVITLYASWTADNN